MPEQSRDNSSGQFTGKKKKSKGVKKKSTGEVKCKQTQQGKFAHGNKCAK